jgi:hypothetical protein
MAKRTNQGIASQYPGVLDQVKERALEQARRVPWTKLAAAVQKANEWETFTLWLRAVVDAAGKIPLIVDRELETRVPGLIKAVETQMPPVLNADAPGHELWNLAYDWGIANIFSEPYRNGWLDAVHYFSSMSLPYMKAWAHWERVNTEWRTNPPAEWPSYQQWQSEVAAVTQSSNPESVAQRVLDAVNSVPKGEWEHFFSRFFDLVAFSLWMELVLDIDGPRSRVLMDELAKRYPGFAFSRPGQSSREAVRDLNSWVIENTLRVDDESVLAALSWHVRNDPAYYALRNYAAECHECWSDHHPGYLPYFDEWRNAADNYISRS